LEANIVEIPLTKGQVALVDAEYEHLVKRYSWRSSSKGYAEHRVYSYGNQKRIFMHRFIWEVTNGPIPDDREIDHRNGNKTDNRVENLRLVTHRENIQNRSDKRNGTTTSKYPGVSWHKSNQKWIAQIRINGVRRSLGCFNTQELASEAYQNALAELPRAKVREG